MPEQLLRVSGVHVDDDWVVVVVKGCHGPALGLWACMGLEVGWFSGLGLWEVTWEVGVRGERMGGWPE